MSSISAILSSPTKISVGPTSEKTVEPSAKSESAPEPRVLRSKAQARLLRPTAESEEKKEQDKGRATVDLSTSGKQVIKRGPRGPYRPRGTGPAPKKKKQPSKCPHGRQRSRCKECFGKAICEHGRERKQCKECGGVSICKHGKRKNRCLECGGSSICEHGKRRSRCKLCGGTELCEHLVIKHNCVKCHPEISERLKQARRCEHGGFKKTCILCDPSREKPKSSRKRRRSGKGASDLADDTGIVKPPRSKRPKKESTAERHKRVAASYAVFLRENVFLSHESPPEVTVQLAGGKSTSEKKAGEDVDSSPVDGARETQADKKSVPSYLSMLTESLEVRSTTTTTGSTAMAVATRKNWQCVHLKSKSHCRICGGSAICIHGRTKYCCKDCKGSGLCPHLKPKRQCRECKGSAICEHGRIKGRCRDCGGKYICSHGRERWRCKDCGGSSICEHGRIRYDCKDCGGKGFCVHGRRKHKCVDCGTLVNKGPQAEKSDGQKRAGKRKKATSSPGSGTEPHVPPASEEAPARAETGTLLHTVDATVGTQQNGAGSVVVSWTSASATQANSEVASGPPRKRRGRPPGSKNKKADVSSGVALHQAQQPPGVTDGDPTVVRASYVVTPQIVSGSLYMGTQQSQPEACETTAAAKQQEAEQRPDNQSHRVETKSSDDQAVVTLPDWVLNPTFKNQNQGPVPPPPPRQRISAKERLATAARPPIVTSTLESELPPAPSDWSEVFNDSRQKVPRSEGKQRRSDAAKKDKADSCSTDQALEKLYGPQSRNWNELFTSTMSTVAAAQPSAAAQKMKQGHSIQKNGP